MIRTANAEWNGGLKDGTGHMKTGTGAVDGQFSFNSRMGDGTTGTNPEELIAAAHAGCYSMQFSAMLEHAGYPANSVQTSAKVHFGPVDGGFAIGKIELATTGDVPGISADEFESLAQSAKVNCPVSKALSAVEITLTTTLSK
ncbi:MAG: OsmC family protein [Armatimonadetes bacterium]|nr:OsmC family protein [Armatimonadota bacterium]